MALEFPIATLASLKTRLGWETDDADVLLLEMLNAVSGVMESVVGRSLRRVHAKREVFSGGRDIIRLGVSPVAKIHHIRESETRSFTDSDDYTELVEGDDYILDPGPSGNTPGEDGTIRRVGATWMGDRGSPGQIEVVYSGGYKTDGEADLESAEVQILASRHVDDYHLHYNPSTGYPHTIAATTDTLVTALNNQGIGGSSKRPMVVFDVSESILPTWQVYAATATFVLETAVGSPAGTAYLIDPNDVDVTSASPEDLYDAILTGEAVKSLTMAATNNIDLIAAVAATIATLEHSILAGRVAIGFVNTKTDDSEYTIKTVEHATVADRPSLTVSHRPGFNDSIVMPPDLKHACLLQSSYTYQSRARVGQRVSSQRGVAVASGASVAQDPVDLLPEVQRILARYVRAY